MLLRMNFKDMVGDKQAFTQTEVIGKLETAKPRLLWRSACFQIWCN